MEVPEVSYRVVRWLQRIWPTDLIPYPATTHNWMADLQTGWHTDWAGIRIAIAMVLRLAADAKLAVTRLAL